MSRIEHAAFFNSRSATMRQKHDHNRVAHASKSFHQTLVSATEAEVNSDSERRHKKEHVLNLMQRINRISEELHKKVTWSAIVEYKKAVMSLLATIKEDLFRTQEIASHASNGTNKRFFLIKKIDNKLNAIFARFIEREQAQLQVLEMVGEINGLLFDLQS